jgi:hypothetical protein
MEEALARMEAGEDPDKVEEELGDALDGLGDDALPGEDAAGGGAARGARRLAGLRRRMLPPAVDDRLYEM